MATSTTHKPVIIDRHSLRVSSVLLIAGEVIYLITGALHPAREMANNHVAVFGEYAESTNWTLTHLGQFLGMALILAGVLALYLGLRADFRIQGWLSRFGTAATIASLALYAVLQAVDGVALKQAVNAWAQAPAAEKAARFAVAEAVRWLEWGLRSYQSIVFGLVLVLLGILIAWTARVPRAIGYVTVVCGLAYCVQGVIVGNAGFAELNTWPTLLGYLTLVAWTAWFAVAVWRIKAPTA